MFCFIYVILSAAVVIQSVLCWKSLKWGYVRAWWKSFGPSCGRDKLIMLTFSMHVRTHSAIDKPIGQEITNEIRPDHSRCQKWSVLCTSQCTSIKCSATLWGSFLHINWHETSKSETLNPSLQCKVPKAQKVKE